MPENKPENRSDFSSDASSENKQAESSRSLRTTYTPATGVVFAGRNGLDFLELRLGSVRIPEVSLRIREAQRIFDGLDIERIDLLSATTTEDDSFFRNIKIKSLLAAIVQVGLYDRLLKTQRAPDVLVGSSNGDSALLVCARQMTFEEMIRGSAALKTLPSLAPRDEASALSSNGSQSGSSPGSSGLPSGVSLGLLPGFQAPLGGSGSPSAFAETDRTSARESLSVVPSLSGLSLTEFRAFQRTDDGSMVEVGQPVMDLKRLMTEVVEHQSVARFINVGPGLAVPTNEYEQMAEAAGADEVTVIDSINLDPMLNWFWREVRPLSGYAQ